MSIRCHVWILLLLSLLLNQSLQANNHFERAFTDGQQVAHSQQSEMERIIAQADPTILLQNFNPHSTLEDYFIGIDQTSPDLSIDALAQVNQHAGAQIVLESFNQRPVVTINNNDPTLEQGQQILDDAYSILDGTSACQTLPPLCETTYSYPTCEVGNTANPITCRQTLTVAPGHMQQTTQTLTLAVSATRSNWLNMPAQVISFSVDIASGKLLATSGGNTFPGSRVTVSPKYQVDTCDTLGTNTSASPTASFIVTKAPSCKRSTIHFNVTVPANRISVGTTVTLTLEIKSTTATQDNWQSNCELLAAQTSCQVTQPARCIEGRQTRMIDGIAITRNCWSKQLSYSCGENIDTCSATARARM